MSRWLLTLAVLLCSCSAYHQPPPPYDVYYCAGTPDEDIGFWRGAMDEWETQARMGVLFVEHEGERPEGACGLLLCAADLSADEDGDTRGRYDPSECTPQILYESRWLYYVRQHELGHALGLGHAKSGTMKRGDGWNNNVTPEDGERLRKRWGL